MRAGAVGILGNGEIELCIGFGGLGGLLAELRGEVFGILPGVAVDIDNHEAPSVVDW